MRFFRRVSDSEDLGAWLEEWAERDEGRAREKLEAYFQDSRFTLWGKSYNIYDKDQLKELVDALMRLLTESEVIQSPTKDWKYWDRDDAPHKYRS